MDNGQNGYTAPVIMGDDIRRARDAAGLTQAELGALVGCSGSVISRYERGEQKPRGGRERVIRETLAERIGDALTTAEESAMLEAFRGLPAELRSATFAFATSLGTEVGIVKSAEAAEMARRMAAIRRKHEIRAVGQERGGEA